VPQLRNIFGKKASRVLRVMLTAPSRKWVLRELAREAQVSLGMAYYVTSSLVRMGFAARENSNRLSLSDPYRLIRQWAGSHSYVLANRFIEYYTFDTEFDAFLSRFRILPRKVKTKYALTLHAAAWLMAPHVRPTDFHTYVQPNINRKEVMEFAQALGVSPTEKSGNVKFVIPYDEGVLYSSRRLNGVMIVSPVQLYVDLYNYPGRGEEAAQKLLEEIAKDWQA